LEGQKIAVVSAAKYKAYSDPELIALCLKGDAFAWEALIMRYRRLIYSVPVRFGFEEADSSDVFQSVCVKLLEHLGEVKDDRKISGWLITTTMRQCLHVKSQKGRETPTADTYLSDPEDPSINMEELRIMTEQKQVLREAVESLAVRCRVLVHLLYFDNRSPSYDQISHELGIPVASIGPTRARCLEKLRTILRRRRIRGAEAAG
jgi:RNA polymerase sigma factor (sigma-70 family)